MISGGVVGGVWAFLAAVLDHLGSKFVLEGTLANFGQGWKGQDGGKMNPESSKMGHVGAKLTGFCGQEAPRNSEEGLVVLEAFWPIW